MTDDVDLADALTTLVKFLGEHPLTARIAQLEHALDGATTECIPDLLDENAIGSDLLQAAFTARENLGRINDLIHATAITLALPHILEPGEILRRPSLAAGNDPTRPFDVETDRRVAEFKLSRWQGADAMRKRQVFKDLVHLAADQSGRDAELYVIGSRPATFLRSTKSKASWGLDRFPTSQALFQERFGTLDVSISEFVAGPGQRVSIIDLEDRLPALFSGEQ